MPINYVEKLRRLYQLRRRHASQHNMGGCGHPPVSLADIAERCPAGKTETFATTGVAVADTVRCPGQNALAVRPDV
jgi:hypothetical protein